jgi:hypothetical protein
MDVGAPEMGLSAAPALSSRGERHSCAQLLLILTRRRLDRLDVVVTVSRLERARAKREVGASDGSIESFV